MLNQVLAVWLFCVKDLVLCSTRKKPGVVVEKQPLFYTAFYHILNKPFRTVGAFFETVIGGFYTLSTSPITITTINYIKGVY